MKRENKKKLFYGLIFILFYITIPGLTSDDLNENKEYQQDLNKIRSLRKSFTPVFNNDINNYEVFMNEVQEKWENRNSDINNYEIFANQIQEKWKVKNPDYYARLMLEICGPLSSGTFRNNRRFFLARQYALSALSEPNRISVETELDLTGHLETSMIRWYFPNDPIWPEFRKNDTELRFHAWKRLLDSIDPLYEKTSPPKRPITPEGLPSGVGPESVKDTKLRTEFKEALDEYNKIIEWRNWQYRFRQDLKWFSKQNEQYIVHLYSTPPYNNEELQKLLDRFLKDENIKDRIMTAVRTNIERAAKDKPK